MKQSKISEQTLNTETEAAPKRRRMIIQDRNGNDIDVPVRDALPVTARRVRYPGFKQEAVILKKGSIRMKGYMPLPCDILLDRDVPVKLSDGTTIYTDVFRPVDEEEHPALLALSPYGKEIGGQWLDDIPLRSGVKKKQTSGLHKFEGPDPAYWVQHGYAVINPDVRGAYNSEGIIRYFGSGYGRDGKDIIDWAADQKWSNGKVGMTGNSWLAISQWFTAAEHPEALKAIAPWEGLNDSFREVGTHGGAPTAEFVEIMSDTFASTPEGGIEDSIAAVSEHPVMDAYWEDKSVPLETIDVPAYIVASWTNFIHTYGTFEGWRRISSDEKWLRVHNTNEWQDYYTPENVEDLRKFFDHYLKNEDNGWEETPRVRLSVLNPGGKDIVGRVENEFPLARTQYKKLYLNSEKRSLQFEPVSEEGSRVYNSDVPGDEVRYRLRITEPTEITGYIKLRLWVSALDAEDMDLAVKMEKLSPLGFRFPGSPTSEPAAKGYIRVSMRDLDPELSTEENPRQSMKEIRKIQPGEIVPVDILIWPMGMMFGKGDILQLTVKAHKTDKKPKGPMASIFGSAKVRISKDTFTYMPGERPRMITLGGNSKETSPDSKTAQIPQDANKGHHVIYAGGKYDSYLYLPFIPKK